MWNTILFNHYLSIMQISGPQRLFSIHRIFWLNSFLKAGLVISLASIIPYNKSFFKNKFRQELRITTREHSRNGKISGGFFSTEAKNLWNKNSLKNSADYLATSTGSVADSHFEHFSAIRTIFHADFKRIGIETPILQTVKLDGFCRVLQVFAKVYNKGLQSSSKVWKNNNKSLYCRELFQH